MTYPARHSVAFIIEGYTKTACHIHHNDGYGSILEVTEINNTHSLDELAAKNGLIIVPVRGGLRRAINPANEFAIHDISQTFAGMKDGFNTKLVFAFKQPPVVSFINEQAYGFSSELPFDEMQKLVNADGTRQVIVEPAFSRPVPRVSALCSPDSLPKRHVE